MTDQRPLTPEYISSLFVEQQEAIASRAVDQIIETVKKEVKYDNVKALLLQGMAFTPKPVVRMGIGRIRGSDNPETRRKCLAQLTEYIGCIVDLEHYAFGFDFNLADSELLVFVIQMKNRD